MASRASSRDAIACATRFSHPSLTTTLAWIAVALAMLIWASPVTGVPAELELCMQPREAPARRYTAVIFPVYIVLGHLLTRMPKWGSAIVYAVCIFLLATYALYWLRVQVEFLGLFFRETPGRSEHCFGLESAPPFPPGARTRRGSR